MRTFDTGATRDDNSGKLHYGAYLSPQALEAFAKYMKVHETQADGEQRPPDNWKRGIDTDAYMDSMWRHFWDVWNSYGDSHTDYSPEEMIEPLCALFFNVQGMLHEMTRRPVNDILNITWSYPNYGPPSPYTLDTNDDRTP